VLDDLLGMPAMRIEIEIILIEMKVLPKPAPALGSEAKSVFQDYSRASKGCLILKGERNGIRQMAEYLDSISYEGYTRIHKFVSVPSE
jgi:hypothetical protein